MNDLTHILLRNGNFLTFVLCEAVCFWLIINFNSAQQEIALETYSIYSSRYTRRANELAGYFSLYDKMRLLQEENAALRARLPSSTFTDTIDRDSFVSDSLRQRFVFTAAEVINKSPFGPDNSFVIDKGSFHGIESGLGVVGPKGLVGITTTVARRHSRIMPILHRDSRVSAGIENEQGLAYGSLSWDGRDPRFMTLNDIPRYVNITEGDTVRTTGYSNLFPSGIPIGTVSKFEAREGSNNWTVTVRLINDLLRTRHVYVVTDLIKEDIQQLNAAE